MDGHLAVLLNETLAFLNPQPGGRYIDATLGAGGHTQALLERSSPDGHVMAIDLDESALTRGRDSLASYGSRLSLVHGNFRDVLALSISINFQGVDGVMADIGVSSMMLDQPERGFSFMREGPLDMRMDQTQDLTAADLANTASEREIADILYIYGEERRSRPIARSIVRSRPLATTSDLVRAVQSVMGGKRFGKIHPATRTFQAFRIAVNGELENLKAFLSSAPACLKPGGRLAVITFHSLEDRIVKNSFRSAMPPGTILTKKVVTATTEEIAANPRARSAKLRVWEKSHGH